MAGKVIILGARGRFGRAASWAFYEAGWDVLVFARVWDEASPQPNAVPIEGDAFDSAAVARAAEGCDVIVNALNPPYPRWKHDLPRLNKNVIDAAKATGATAMIPGNVYNYGEAMPDLLTEKTPQVARTRKGRLRVAMEQACADSAEDGVRTIVLRAGDFIER